MVSVTVTVFQLDLLGILRDHGALTVKKLAAVAEGRSTESIRIQLRKLFAAGLISRSVLPGTRHTYRYSLADSAAVFFPDRRIPEIREVVA